MRLHHLSLALLVVAIWGFNFVVIKVGLKEIPPLLFCAARFFLAAFPAVFFIKRPNIPLRMIAGFGLTMFTLQFACLFSGMYAGTSAGLASLLLQIQVFVTILLAVVFLAEQPSWWQIGGAVISFSGIGMVAANFGGDISIFGLMLILLAAVAWGTGNLISKKLGKVDMFALIIWSSLFAWPPLLALSFVLESSSWNMETLTHISWPTIGAISYVVYPATLLGYVAWGWLLSHYPAATVAPFTLLVPVFGISASALALGEPLSNWKIYAAILVLSGLCINLFGPRLALRKRTV